MNKNQNIFPNYDREKCKIGFAHIGVGNFHPAHQAYYINKYMDETNDLEWGIIGINLRASEKENLENLKKRDGKYILKTGKNKGNQCKFGIKTEAGYCNMHFKKVNPLL